MVLRHTCKPGSVLESIYLGAYLAVPLMRRVKKQSFTAPPCCGVGLPSGICRHTPGELLPHRFTLAVKAVCFLWHFPSSYDGSLLG